MVQCLLVIGNEAIELVLVRVVELLNNIVLFEATLLQTVLVKGDHALLFGQTDQRLDTEVELEYERPLSVDVHFDDTVEADDFNKVVVAYENRFLVDLSDVDNIQLVFD